MSADLKGPRFSSLTRDLWAERGRGPRAEVEVAEGTARDELKAEGCRAVTSLRIPGGLDLGRTVEGQHGPVITFLLPIVCVPNRGLLFAGDGDHRLQHDGVVRRSNVAPHVVAAAGTDHHRF